METRLAFVDCPAVTGGGVTCGLPAEVEDRYTLGSTGGPVACLRIRCPLGHWFNGPAESLAGSQRPAGPAVSRRRWPPLPIWEPQGRSAARGGR